MSAKCFFQLRQLHHIQVARVVSMRSKYVRGLTWFQRRAPIAARWADRFSRCWWRRFSRFLACPLILPLPRGEYPQWLPVIVYLCSTPALLPSRRRRAAPELQWCVLQCNAAITLYTVHRNTDLNPKYLHRFAFLAFASGTYLKVISITEKEHCVTKL